ncbi:MAG: RING finger domain-containing protein [Nitrososphaerota archaeon]|nr:RING finger protein [Candidatus Calditenuaceae archaeon]MDW8073226.1 RING finger domain-containing protein [Nitrososphaerota archaeon]
MITQVGEALARFSRIGALVSLLGATHALSLILNWFSINYDDVGRSMIAGYTFMEPLMLSLAAGGTAGVSCILASNLKDISKLRLITPLLSFTAAGLALLSPLYTYLIKLPSFGGLDYAPEIGLFAALFTGIAIAGASALALIAGLRTRVTTQLSPPPYWTPVREEPETFSEISEPIAETQVTVVEPTPEREPRGPETPEGQCLICGDLVSTGELEECKSCGALFHKDCMNVWVDLGNKCPACGGELRG